MKIKKKEKHKIKKSNKKGKRNERPLNLRTLLSGEWEPLLDLNMY